uniref:MATH domain-containing protein n=1 Tax=Oryza punctata TaxID=4537 RepID=A0A0E0MH92_ORYPU
MMTRRHDVGCATTSTIVAPPNPTGHYVVRIDGYSQTKARVAAGDYVGSLGFTVGGHAWKIRYYHYTRGPVDVKARFVFSLLDRDGEPVPSHTYTSEETLFSNPSRVFGSSRFISHDDLEKSGHLIGGERFAVRCDVTVMKGVEVRAGPPPSSLGAAEASALRRKLDTGRGEDVRFRAGGKTFTRRSPELEAILCSRRGGGGGGGGCFFTRMITRRWRIIEVDDDMDAAAFRALLHASFTRTRCRRWHSETCRPWRRT